MKRDYDNETEGYTRKKDQDLLFGGGVKTDQGQGSRFAVRLQ